MSEERREPEAGATWIVVTDGAHAEIFSRARQFSDLESVQAFDEPEARSRELDLGTDAPGRSFDSHGQGRHSMDPAQSGKAHLRESFARRIAAEVESGRSAGRFRNLVLVATPDMLGALRAQLSGTSRQLVRREIVKQMTRAAPAEIAAAIDAE